MKTTQLQITVFLAFSICALICADTIAYAQSSTSNYESKPSHLTAGNAQKVRSLLSKGKSEQAWKLLGGKIWCQNTLVSEWDERKNLALAADLGMYARKFGKLEQALNCTLLALERQGTKHQAAALFELASLVELMDLESLSTTVNKSPLFTNMTFDEKCQDKYLHYLPAKENVYCALQLSSKAPDTNRKKVARKRLLSAAASYAPKTAYLKHFTKEERSHFVNARGYVLRLQGRKSVTATSRKQMWKDVRPKIAAELWCSKPLDERGEEESDCVTFVKDPYKKPHKSKEITVASYKVAGGNGGYECPEMGTFYVLPFHESDKGVTYIRDMKIGTTDGCGTALQSAQAAVTNVKEDKRAVFIDGSNASSGEMTMSGEYEVPIYWETKKFLCQLDGDGSIYCLQYTYKMNHPSLWEHDTYASSAEPHPFPLFTIESGRLKLREKNTGSFYFKEYEALEGLTIREAIAKFPAIEKTIDDRYVNLSRAQTEP